jgi:hypothetical protein
VLEFIFAMWSFPMNKNVVQSGPFYAWKRLLGVTESKKDTTILTALLGTQEIARITHRQAPVELRPSVPITSDTLTFIDSRAKAYNYDLSSIRRERAKWLHISIRVSDQFTAQMDGLVNDTSSVPEQLRGPNAPMGIRFQPMYLPECPKDPAELMGKGLFFRGLHYPGWVTPGSVSLMCICDYCAKSFRLQSFHAGFGFQLYFYCDMGTHTLVIPDSVIGAPPLTGLVDPEVVSEFDARLPRCERCGGHFKYYNPLRCPHCHQPYIDFDRYPRVRAVEYYGNNLYGDTPQLWDPKAGG